MVTDAVRCYDIFLSFSGTELDRVLKIKERLVDLGISVFIDRNEILPAKGVSERIEQGLAGSKMCVFYYSARFAVRHACQFELMQAFVSDAREGGETRLLVVNPLPGKGHIQPVELQDAIYIPDDGSPAALDQVVDKIRHRLMKITGTFQKIDFLAWPPAFFAEPGVDPRVRRYSAIWALRSALYRANYPMTQAPANRTAVLAGLSGSGKTSLVDDYILHFRFAYTVVEQIDLHNQTENVLETYAREIGEMITMDTSAWRPDDIRDAVRVMLSRVEGDVLWVIDNISPDLDEDVVKELVFPLGNVHTVLITQQRRFAGVGELVELDGLTEDESAALFALYRQPEPDEQELVRALVDRVHGHPMAIAQLAGAAADRQGLHSLMEHVGRVVDGTSDVLDQVAEVFVDRLRDIEDEDQLMLLRLSAVCAAEPLPVRFVRDVLRRFDITENRMLSGWTSLRRRLLVGSAGERWSVHPIVRHAVRRYVVEPGTDIAVAAAEVLMGFDDLANADTLLLHAQHLATTDELPLEIVTRLLRHVGQRLMRAGRPALAARYFDRLLGTGMTDPDAMMAAATCHLDVGEYAEAVQLAGQVRGDREWSAALILATALDSLGRLDDAESAWARVALPEVLDNQPEGVHLDARLRWIRSRRLRGSMKDHKDFLVNLLASHHDLDAYTVNAARLELANIQMQTDGQIDARQNARQVVDYYNGIGQSHHPQAIEAQFALANADLLVHLLEFKPDHSKWSKAEQTLRALATEQEQKLGARNIQVLTFRVGVAHALVSQGKAREARRYSGDLLAVLRSRVDSTHPLALRCVCMLGMAHSQLAEFDAAVTCLDEAHTGQLAAFGLYHPETLRTQFELGMALRMQRTGDNGRANALLDGVRMAAPSVTGPLNDLYGQGVVATTIVRYAPRSWLLRAHRANHKHKW